MRTTGNINIYDGFNFCTTLEQSKQLLELGLNPETSDMTYLTGIRDGEEEIYGILPYKELVPACRKGNILYKNVPAWTYYKLLTLLPKEYILFSQRSMGTNITSEDIISVNLYEGVEGLLTIIKNEAFIERINKEFLIKENMDTTWTNLRDKLPEYPKSCDCRNCMNAGEAKDFMVFYSVLNIYRSVGIRPYCAKFKNK